MNLRTGPYQPDHDSSTRRGRDRIRGKPTKYRGWPLADRLWVRVEVQGECWVWTGSRHAKGYGQMWNGHKTVKTHRVSYELAYGPIPDGLQVCHRCDNPPCVRPDHLFLGTNQDNVDDAYQKGHFHGRRHPTATEMHAIDAETAAEILRQRAAGATQQAIADAFGISRRSVQRVLEGTHWTAAA